ncbi:transcription termination/antitermination protein NusG [Alkalibacterium sp. s-m-22]|jgi:transcriptional antiterminator NusG|uniref:Transcription termination/antitermination protein NusG n=3 Tax=Alkalibacterium TaxID=99906 RepID=A0A1H7MHF0_9LACT|nr:MULTISPECIES: transcription termination/antitermination protein NusG [Alkalibacterium]MCD8506133.1 transcription termination/antitermination protein NusG [Alkalibacterium thalassium]GEN51058.1 transcription termination/antitermination protein NusG [Alkalibacterium pelagium]SDJ92867.1 transcription antitermination protein nusG [Alkalibacterium thalassium]SEL10125.1 transcription antitermination protein nusG [Alkalibacterium pelagium]
MNELESAKAWYVLHTYSGYENKVKQNLESRAKSMNMEERILQVIIPEEETTTEKDGKTKMEKEKIFPGYVLVEMIMSDDAWYVVRNTPGVTGFVGSHGAGSKPSPLLPEEIDQILRSMGINPRKIEMDVELGERIKIVGGAFAGMEGTVTELETEKGKIKASVEMFGRETNAELDYNQISKLDD